LKVYPATGGQIPFGWCEVPIQIFMFQILVTMALLAAVCAAPQYGGQLQGQYSTPIPIISQNSIINPDGSYQYR